MTQEAMRRKRPYPADLAKRVRELIHYDAESGVITWRATVPATKRKPGTKAGSVNHEGYACIQIEGRKYLAHRIIWLYAYGEISANPIDHINGIKLDNRLINLRLVTVQRNAENQRRAHRDNPTGFLGVSFKNGAYRAQIQTCGKKIDLGSFGTAQAAHQAYIDAKKDHHQGSTI